MILIIRSIIAICWHRWEIKGPRWPGLRLRLQEKLLMILPGSHPWKSWLSDWSSGAREGITPSAKLESLAAAAVYLSTASRGWGQPTGTIVHQSWQVSILYSCPCIATYCQCFSSFWIILSPLPSSKSPPGAVQPRVTWSHDVKLKYFYLYVSISTIIGKSIYSINTLSFQWRFQIETI